MAKRLANRSSPKLLSVRLLNIYPHQNFIQPESPLDQVNFHTTLAHRNWLNCQPTYEKPTRLIPQRAPRPRFLAPFAQVSPNRLQTLGPDLKTWTSPRPWFRSWLDSLPSKIFSVLGLHRNDKPVEPNSLTLTYQTNHRSFIPPQSLGAISMAHGMSLGRTGGGEHPVYQLKIRQQPECARVAIGKEKGMFTSHRRSPPVQE